MMLRASNQKVGEVALPRRPSDPELARWAGWIEQLRWAGLILDQGLRLVWVSPEVERFLGSPRKHEIGYGLHVSQVLTRDVWRRVSTSGTRERLLHDLGPFVARDRNEDTDSSRLDDERTQALQATDPKPIPLRP